MKICSICKSENSDNAKYCQSMRQREFSKKRAGKQGVFSADFYRCERIVRKPDHQYTKKNRQRKTLYRCYLRYGAVNSC